MSQTSLDISQTHNGPAGDEDDQFERDLKEMLKDGPSLSDLSSTVQGGAGHGAATHTVPRAAPSTYAAGTGSMPRSHTVPPGTSPEQTVTSNIPLSSPERNGGGYSGGTSPSSAPSIQIGANSKIDTLKAWSINTYKCTRQMISERFGKAGSRTVDLELEAQIEALRDTQKKYANILRLARALTNHFYHVVQTQRAMGDAFSELSQKSPELQDEFSYNSETQKTLSKNGETLLGALNFFTSSVNTLCNKTMEDTLMTIRQYETSRIEFDAYRTDFEVMQNGPRDSTTMAKMEEAQKKYAAHKEKFDKLRADVSIKLKFLEENKVTVWQRQLKLLHEALLQHSTANCDTLHEHCLSLEKSSDLEASLSEH